MSDEKNPVEKNDAEALEELWDELYAMRKARARGAVAWNTINTFLDQTQLMIDRYRQGRKDGYYNGE